ncbi:MAG: oxidoreductase [Anaerolineae bacterium]|nr:oxidoreductase [Anaerolineae bacterium]
MGKTWTTGNIPDLTGKNVIVTGANSGIGYETAKELARKGANTTLACRNFELGQQARDTIHDEIPGAVVGVMPLDLADLNLIRAFNSAYHQQYDRLDILINNAGIMMGPYAITVDGFERQFGTNHLGHFALTGLLLDMLIATPYARVVNVSSLGHRFGTMDFDNLMYLDGKDYMPARAYGRSKLANLLFTYELQRRYDANDIPAVAVAAHPGISYTNLTGDMAGQWFLKLTTPLQKLWLQSAAMGALPSLRAATDPDVTGGQYYGPDGRREQRGYPVVVRSSEASNNEDDAQKLWEISEALTGIKFEQLS